MESIHIVDENLPRAWERAVLATWEHGSRFPTQFDKDSDPNSRDVAALIHVTNPLSEPRIHRMMPGSLEDLEKYRMEVLHGVHDHWIDLNDPAKWDYTYNQRLMKYGPVGPYDENGYFGAAFHNQFNKMVEQLKACPFTRRAQMITWQPWRDPDSADPPCLQRIWARIETETCLTCHGKGEIAHGLCVRCDATGKINRLHMDIHIRSNDAFKAAFMNMYAFVELQEMMAEAISTEDFRVEVGEYLHFADSFHIYGSYFEDFERGFLNMVAKRSWEDRTYNTSDATPSFIMGLEDLLKETDPEIPHEKRALIRTRRHELMGVTE